MSFRRSYVLGLAISRSLLLGLIIEGITVISFSRKMGVLDPLSSYLIPILPYSQGLGLGPLGLGLDYPHR